VYIAGWSGVGGPVGLSDSFVTKYNAEGQHQWTHQDVTPLPDVAQGVSADGLGNVYISGRVMGAEYDSTTDAYVSKYDADGVLQWTQQFGTDRYDHSWGVSADGVGSVYVVGQSGGSLADPGLPNPIGRDAFIRKYDAQGTLQWTRQGEQDASFGVSADALGNVFVSGAIASSGVTSALVSKYAADGVLEWTRQLGDGIAREVSADGLGNVYVTGQAGTGSDYDVFLSKIDAAGELLWNTQFGSHNFDVGWHVAAEKPLGNVYLAATISGLGPLVNKYDAEGNLAWTQQAGGRFTPPPAVSTDGLGNLYGSSSIEVIPPNWPDPGDQDVLIAKYIACEGCEPPPLPPIVVDAELSGEIQPGSLVTHQFATSFGDLPVTWSNLVPIQGMVHPPTLSENGLFSWQTSKLDAGGLHQFTVTATNAGGSDTGRLTLRLAIIPEPSALLLVSLGIGIPLLVTHVRD
jgi:hypothetical protein